MKKGKSKTVNVDVETHTKLKVKAAKQGKSIKKLLKEVAEQTD